MYLNKSSNKYLYKNNHPHNCLLYNVLCVEKYLPVFVTQFASQHPVRNVHYFKDAFNPKGTHYGLAYIYIHGVAFGGKNISTKEKTTKASSDSSN